MTKLPENYSKFIFKQLIEAIIYIQSQNIIHRDIKPDNILIDLNNIIKICDFGVGKEIKSNEYVKDTCGTPAFIAPEILLNNNYNPFKTDVWSSGVVLYTMLSGVVPFRGNNDYELHKNILSGKFPKLNFISNSCEDLLNKLLEVNPEKRINLNNILSHKWFSDGINGEICLFTNAEKVIYRKLYFDYRKERKEDLCENFTYKNLESEFDSENKNIDSTSYIITPNNTEINPYYNDDEEIYFSDLMIKDNIMKFNLKVRELNLNYEVKYNADVDQGFLRNEKKNKIMRSLNNSINEIDKKLKENNFDNNNINNLNKEENDIEDEKYNDKKNKLNEKNNFNINEDALKFVEDFGYNREYIIKSLLNNELNHCTATYYLKISLIEE
jgi:serine/threonine protein kinase